MASDISQQTHILVAEMAKLNKILIFYMKLCINMSTLPVKSWAPEVMLWAQFCEFFML